MRDGNYYRRNARLDETLDAMADERLAAPDNELLGSVPANAQALASGDYDGGGTGTEGRCGRRHASRL
jgi:hypothetical protein